MIRRGEFLDLFADMQAQGYVRFRVDGKLVEADELPELKKTEKHDIDARCAATPSESWSRACEPGTPVLTY